MPGICHRCEKTVYFNEERMAIGKSFHKTCFVCANKGCGRRLDSGNLTEHNCDVYCRSCYGRLFGPKGYGFGVGAGILGTDTGSKTVVETVKTVEPIKKPSNSVSSTPSPQPPSSTEASSGSTPVSSGTSSPTSDEAISLESDTRKTPSPVDVKVTPINESSNGLAKTVSNSSINSIANGIAAKLRFGGSEICPRCNKAVYMAERMMGGGSAWHKTSCFNCKECHKRLESTTLCEKDREIYCKNCYRKNWGPKGYGYGVTALQSCK
ncbi:cysteine and glycine-rich protein 1 [Tetranychus urticae]|uniref:LIM zinc-binding domain-containing protein n=1 Tax=Tetranychus urticae TaxID=32264 RepID=T1KWE3_TETUR|nr:cysteine and glycine-rich protein 1 [Tetranychus urticae]